MGPDESRAQDGQVEGLQVKRQEISLQGRLGPAPCPSGRGPAVCRTPLDPSSLCPLPFRSIHTLHWDSNMPGLHTHFRCVPARLLDGLNTPKAESWLHPSSEDFSGKTFDKGLLRAPAR